MNAFEFNKFAGAALSALLFIFGFKTLVEIAGGAHGPAKAGFTLPAPKPGAVAGGGAQEEAFDFAKIAELLPKASAENGKNEVFKACTQCHTPEKGGAHKLGPNLHGIIGRDVGKMAGFTNYSPAMTGKGGKWDWASVANYVYDPRGYVPGNRMAFVGVKDATDLADLLVYLRTLADTPPALPTK